MTAPVDTATRFKPGDLVHINLVGEIDDFGRPRFGCDDRALCDDEDGEGMNVTRLQNLYEAIVTTRPDAPAPYSEPREGDEVEVTVRGVVFRAVIGAFAVSSGDGMCIVTTETLSTALAEGRVRLVKAAAPAYEPGRVYRSPATGGLFLWTGSEDGYPWYRVGQPGILELSRDEVPADLVLCDVVPRETT